MENVPWPNIKAIRKELHLSQSELANILGVSPRTIQSCEQGWRSLGGALEKCLLFVLVVERHGQHLADMHCWEVMQCSPSQRKDCLTYRSQQGGLCWFLTGNRCNQQVMGGWTEKKEVCRHCKFFQQLLPDSVEDTHREEQTSRMQDG